jgi:hypothetical protein
MSNGGYKHQQCYRKLKGEVEVKQREKVVSICPECDKEIEEMQEKTIVSGMEWHKVSFIVCFID